MAEYYQFKIAKWNTSTDDMSLELEAALLRVVNAIRLYDRPITMNLRVLSGLWRCNERKAKRILGELLETGEIVIEDGCIVNRRAVDEASTFNQSRIDKQSAGRRGGIESGKSRRKVLKDKEVSEAPASTIKEKKEEKVYGDGDDARAREPDPPTRDPTDRERILIAIGADPISGMVGPNGRQLGRMADMQIARAWRDDLGLSIGEVVDVIREVVARMPDGPPSTFSYFNQPMQRFAGMKRGPALVPIEGDRHDRQDPRPDRARGAGHSAAGRAHENLIAAFARTIPDE